VRDPFRSDGQRPADLRGATPLTGVQRDPEAAGTRRLERPGVIERVRVGRFGPGQVPAHEAPVAEARRRLGQHQVVRWVMRTQRGADQPDGRPGPPAGGTSPAADGRDPIVQRQAAGDVEQRSPADLDITDLFGGLGVDQLRGDPFERLGVLHERDRQVEGAEQLGLVGAPLGRDERVEHAGPGRRRRYAAGPGQVERRVDAQRAVEVEMELGLGHRLDEPAQGGARQSVGGRFGHHPMLRSRAMNDQPAAPFGRPCRPVP
jgi:hypothetical protein